MNDKLIMKDGKPHKIAEVVMLPTKEQRWKIGNEHDDRYEFYSFVDKKLYSRQSNAYNWSLSHLYILSSEEIKEGDWVLTKKYNNPVKANKFIKSIGWYYSNTLVNDICSGKKIIATTDESLEIACKVECHDCNGKGEQIMPYKDNGEVCSRCSGTGLEDNEKPFLRPSDDFLKAFVKAQGKGFDKVLVEYQAYHGIKTSIAEVNAISGDDSMNWQGRNDLRDYKIKVSPDNTITIKPIQEEKTSWSRKEVIILFKKYKAEVTNAMLSVKDEQWIEQNL